MVTLIIVVVAIFAIIAITTCVAFYRGWFRLAVLPVEDKMGFVLMSKKNTIGLGANQLPAKTEPAIRLDVAGSAPDAPRES